MAAWGGNVTAVKIVITNGEDPFALGAYRFFISLFIIFIFCSRHKIALGINFREFLWLLPIPLLFVSQIATLNFSARYTTSARIGVILNIYPFWVALLSGLIFKEDPLHWRKLAGALLAVGGMFFIFRESFFAKNQLFVGDFLIFISSILLSLNVLWHKVLYNRDWNYMKVIFQEFLWSVPVFFILGLIFDHPLRFNFSNLENMISLLFQGVIIGGFVFMGWNYLLNRLQPAVLSSFFFFVPVFSMIFGYFLLGEPLTAGLWIGMGLIAAGVYFENMKYF